MKKYKKKILGVIILLSTILYIFNDQSAHFLSEELTIYEKIAEGSSFDYLIIGDSIGRGSGAENKELSWFNQMEALIKEDYGSRGRQHLIVQSGATAFEGIYKLQKTRQTQNMDLIFIVFGENDRKFMQPDEFSFFYEKLIRNAKELYPNAELITFVETPLKQEAYAKEIQRISVHYGAKCLDMRIPFEKSGIRPEHLTSDMVHPNGNGYQLYAQTILELIKTNIQKDAVVASIPNPLMKNEFIQFEDNKEIIANKGFFLENGIYVSRNPGGYLEYKFHGPILGVKMIRNEEGGMVNVYIDGQYVRTLSTWWPFAKERYIYIASGLENGQHTVLFESLKDVSAQNKSKKSVIQILSIIVAKE